MVRGNWQKRVETAEARRTAAKQRKQRSETTRQYKQWMHDFVDQLDRHYRERLLPPPPLPTNNNNNNNNNIVKLKVWSDAAPGGGGRQTDNPYREDAGDVVVLVPDSSSGTKGKGQSSSSGGGSVSLSSTTRKGTAASGKKKAHPRSKEATMQQATEAVVVMEEAHQWMCQSYFFTGKCNEKGKGGGGGGKKSAGCRYIHEDDNNDNDVIGESHHRQQHQTLFQALFHSKDATSQLKEADDAMQASRLSSGDDPMATTEPPGAMDAVFFVEEMVLNSLPDEAGDDNPSSWSSQITEMLTRKQLKLSNVVYVVLNDVLVFDRHREGSLFKTDRDFLIAIMGVESIKRRKESFGSEKDAAKLQALPGPILEHILTFLPDEAVAYASQVCKAWHHEIGKNSPNLWKYLLDRRCWPHPRHDDSSSEHHYNYREQFLEHFSIMRDLKAIQSGLHAITYPRGRAVEKEMVFQSFLSRKHAPSHRNDCVDIHEWSPNRVLAAYSDDCSLRLFEAVPKAGSSGEKLCREQICIKVNPYQNTKKRRSSIVSMGLDEEYIGSLCQIQTDHYNDDDHLTYFLVVIHRNDFLLGESLTDNNAESFHVVDIAESVLNYLLSTGSDDDRFQELFDFLSEGRELEEVNVVASHKVLACGSGLFLMMATIAIPEDIDDFIGLFLFSVNAGAIVWMGDVYRDNEMLELRNVTSFSHLPHSSQRSGNHPTCSVVISKPGRSVLLCDINRSGEVQIKKYVSSEIPLNEMQEFLREREAAAPPGWQQQRVVDPVGGSCPVVVTQTDIVCVGTLLVGGHLDRRNVTRRTFLSFFSLHSTADDDNSAVSEQIVFRENIHVLQMALVRQHHIVLMCREYPTAQQRGQNNDPAEETIDGQWFVADEPAETVNTSQNDDDFGVVAIVVHVPTRREIGRVKLLDKYSLDLDLPHLTSGCNETIGVALSHFGIVLTGNDVRSVSEENNDTLDHESLSSNAHKKKKKRQPNRGSKKDGFARGISLRG